MSFTLAPGRLALADIVRQIDQPARVVLDPAARPGIAAAAAVVAGAVAAGGAHYGINTGFGRLARTRIADDQLAELQRRLLRSHACGVGPALAPEAVRLMLLMKAGALARGHSGVRIEVIELLLAMLNGGVLPVVPTQGSVGASGDLAPLAHLCLPLIGEGEAAVDGQVLPGAEALRRRGLAPIDLAPKEGLALINGTQASTALALIGLIRADRLLRAGLVVGALSTDAARGSDGPFDPRLHALRGQPGQIDCAAALRRLLAGSAIRDSHRVDDPRVQDPYCLRCQPQVAGAALDALRAAADVLAREANAVTDNPIVLPDTAEIISGGNFHAEPVALAADQIAVALAEVGAIAERRIALLIDPAFSTLPPFLTLEPGLNSGFMIAHVTAAALASENKGLAHPASVDSLPTSANQEDHVSMAMHAAVRLGRIADNVRRILAIEWLAAAQGVEFHAPLVTSEPLRRAHALLRGRVGTLIVDRALAPDIEAAAELVEPRLAPLAGPPLLRA